MADILLLSLVFPPDSVSTAQIMGELAVDLSKKGHRVTVITTIPHYNCDFENEKNQPLLPKWGKILYKSQFKGITVYHIVMPPKAKNILWRIIAWVFFHIISIIAGWRIVPRPSIILAPSPPLTIGLCAWILGRLHSAPYIYNVQEIYPEIAIRLGVVRNRWIIDILYRLEKFVYSKASAVTVIASKMRDQLLDKGVSNEKVHIIPNFVDVSDLIPFTKDNDFSRKYNLNNKFVVSYAGNMGPAQGLGYFIDAARILRDELGILFLMMGNGILRESLKQRIEQYNLDNFVFLPYQQYSLMGQAYAASDLCMVPQAIETGFEAVPSKVYRIMACARPVLAVTDHNSDLARLVSDSSCGGCVLPGSSVILAKMIMRAFQNQKEWQKMGLSGREYVVRHYDRGTVTNQYHKLIESLISKSGKLNKLC
ncbi:MAG: glycosyltransferase family 4 protein [Desulfamplus sp.]|nr:glycosyltransferase family 4 protein [Desulfamplus sp.]